METPTSFDLDQAIQQWRERLAQSPALHQESLNELETHLRDSIAILERSGLSQVEAFTTATRRLGGERQLQNEFAKLSFFGRWLNCLGRMTTTTWKVQGENSVHTVTLEHSYWSGKAAIVVDDQVVYHRPRKWVDFGLELGVVFDGVACLVRVVCTPWATYWYRLLIDGKKQPVQRCSHTVWSSAMKAVGSWFICGLVVLLMFTGVWFFTNYATTMRMSPDKAAIEVAKRFETTAGNYSAYLPESLADSGKTSPMFVATQDDLGHWLDLVRKGGDTASEFIVRRDGQEIARVTLSPFLNLGWQFQRYERIRQPVSSSHDSFWP